MREASLFVYRSNLDTSLEQLSNSQAEIVRLVPQKLRDHDDVKQQYRDFIKTILDMGHLEQAPQTSGLCYYLPDHCVLKDSTTTKL